MLISTDKISQKESNLCQRHEPYSVSPFNMKTHELFKTTFFTIISIKPKDYRFCSFNVKTILRLKSM